MMGGGYKGGFDGYGKEYINEYTITMDIKLLSPPPPTGLSVFQTALVHSSTKEQKGSAGVKELLKSTGECIINERGGVGIFKTYGDIRKKPLEVGKWHRIVISVKCAAKTGEMGEYRTWIGTNPCATSKGDEFSQNSRFSIDPAAFFLFSSDTPEMMSGNIAIRTLRVEKGSATDATVRANCLRDKDFYPSIKAITNDEEDSNNFFALRQLIRKSRPMWMIPAFLGIFCDKYVGDVFMEVSIF